MPKHPIDNGAVRPAARRLPLLLLFGLASLVRLAVVLSVDYPFAETRLRIPDQDPVVYHQLALSLLDGEGMKSGERGARFYDFRRPPLYPLFLAGVYALFGEKIGWVQMFQILIGAFTVVLSYLLCREYFSENIAYGASLVFALYLPHAALSVAIMTEVLTTLLIAATLLALTRAYRRNSPLYWWLTGLSFGLLILNRQFYKFGWIFIVLAAVFLYYRRPAYLLRNMAAFAAAVLILVIPWMRYVQSVTGTPRFDTIIANPVAIMMAQIMLREEKKGFLKSPQELAQVRLERESLAAEADTGRAVRAGLRHMAAHPGAFARALASQYQFLWLRSFVISDDNRGNMLLDLSPLMKKRYVLERNYAVLLVNLLTNLFAFCGIVGMLRFGAKSLPLAFTVLLTLIGLGSFYPVERYGLPVHNYIILYATAAIAWIGCKTGSRLRGRAAKPPAAPTGLLHSWLARQ